VVTEVKNITGHTEKVISAVRQKSDRAIIFYSCGKDSIAMLDLIAPHFKEVVCVFMYFVKNLDHINRFINVSKAKYPNATFIELPHWNLSWIIHEGVYCKADEKVKTLKLSDMVTAAKQKTGIEYCFLGMKQADSLNRRLMLRGYDLQAINEKSGMVYPLSTWSNKDVIQYIRFNHLPEPVKYNTQKKSQGLGFDLDVFLYLRNHYPSDLAKILKQYPLSESILFEYDRRAGNTTN
jgi:3'-phosphoadenosine 5'-phosphosulfate sulfotransferase (PAPS reductase)/FAD synthetase